MIQAACSKCSASFNVEGKPAGATFKCPKCKVGTITVPAPVLETLEELADAEEVPAEDVELVEMEEVAAPATQTPRPAAGARRPSGANAARPARAPRAPAAASAPKPKSKAIPIGIGVGLALAVGGFFAFKGGSKPDAKPSDTSTAAQSSADTSSALATNAPSNPTAGGSSSATPTTPVAKSANPKEEIAAKRAALAPTDIAGRLALAKMAADAGLNTERTLILREVALLDPNEETARSALGFTKYDGRAVPYRGRWMDKEDAALATRAEEWLDGTSTFDGAGAHVSGGASDSSGASGATDSSSPPSPANSGSSTSGAGGENFASEAKELQAKMQADYPDSQFDYRFDDGIMPRPYVAAIQRASGTSADELEKLFGKAFDGLYRTFMDRYRERFQLEDVAVPIPVVLFGGPEEHDAFVLKRDPHATFLAKNGIGGYFTPGNRMLTLYRQPKLMGVLFHEGTHQLVHFAVGPNFKSPWFQEGIAEFFGGHRIKQVPDANGQLVNRYELGQFIAERFGYLQQQIPSSSAMTVQELTHFGYDDFHAAQADARDAESQRKTLLVYSEGWALIMYLHYAEGGALKAKFDEYFEAEANGESSGDKFGEILGLASDADWAAFDKKFKDWVMTELPKMRR